MANIKLSDVEVEFPVHNSNSRSLQMRVLSSVGGQIADHNRSIVIQALRKINLEIPDGGRIGLVGHNGSGKTTLLRVLSGAYEPSRGVVEVRGRLSSLTDITLGMDTEATGRDNIIFRSVFMGLGFKEARELAPSIEEFSELGEFLSMPVRTYSTGMFLRLAFAISTAVDPEIMIMDEMIGTGDLPFLAKAKKRLNEMIERVSILVLATHDSTIMESLCKDIVWLRRGEIQEVGPFHKTYPKYLKSIGG